MSAVKPQNHIAETWSTGPTGLNHDNRSAPTCLVIAVKATFYPSLVILAHELLLTACKSPFHRSLPVSHLLFLTCCLLPGCPSMYPRSFSSLSTFSCSRDEVLSFPRQKGSRSLSSHRTCLTKCTICLSGRIH